MLELKHPNLNTFIGACIEPPNIVVAWEYCNKGSLQDVINNDSMKLDDMFKFSICIEILKVMDMLSCVLLHDNVKCAEECFGCRVILETCCESCLKPVKLIGR